MGHYKDRHQAGEKLASLLNHYKNFSGGVVLGIPRGGVIVASVVAQALNLPLEIVPVKKIGIPGNPEVALGALAGGIEYLDKKAIKNFKVSDEYLEVQRAVQEREVRRREKLYQHQGEIQNFEFKTVIIVDDGIATGATTKAVISYAKSRGAATIIAAAPVSPEKVTADLKDMVDGVFCPLKINDEFFSVSNYYQKFEPVTDAEVLQILKDD